VAITTRLRLPDRASDLDLFRWVVHGNGQQLGHALEKGGGLLWAHLFGIAQEHGLTEFYARTLDRLGLLGGAPDPVIRHLHRQREHATAMQDLLIGRMEDLRQRLAERGIDVVFLKGPFLARRFYDDPGARRFEDIDLLVLDSRQRRITDRLLQSMGYRRRSRALLGRQAVSRFVHHFEYERPGTVVDLHWAFRQHFTFAIDYDLVWQTREHATLEPEASGSRFAVLSPEYVLLLLLLSVHSDIERGRCRLKHFVDIHRVLLATDPTIDWSRFLERRTTERTLDVTLAMLALTFTLLGTRPSLPNIAVTVENWRASTAAGRSAYADVLDLDFVQDALPILQWAPHRLRHKLWAFRLYAAPVPASFAWWLASQPFKRAVYR
jgi:hypothetical protein